MTRETPCVRHITIAIAALMLVACGDPEEKPAEDDAFGVIAIAATTRETLVDLLLDVYVAGKLAEIYLNPENDGCARLLAESVDLFMNIHRELQDMQDLELDMWYSYVAHDWEEFAQHRKTADAHVQAVLKLNANTGLLAARVEERCLP